MHSVRSARHIVMFAAALVSAALLSTPASATGTDMTSSTGAGSDMLPPRRRPDGGLKAKGGERLTLDERGEVAFGRAVLVTCALLGE